MTISGNLKTMPLADILQWVSNGGYTGTLVVGRGEVEKSLYVRDGRLISCTSNDPKEFLGHFLVSKGLISEQDIASAMTLQDSSRELLGKILVDQGAISQTDLERMLKLKAEEAIYDLFRWDEGQFRFIDGQLPQHRMVPIEVDVTELVFEGTRRADDWLQIVTAIPSPLCVPVAVGDLLEGEHEEGRRAVLELVNADRSIEEICLETHSSEFHVCEILYRKVRDGLLKVVRPRIQPPASDQKASTASALMEEAREHIAERRFEQALRRLRAAKILEPDDSELLRGVREAENEIRASLEINGIDPAGVPVLVTPPAELSSVDLSPEEGFILSRINGQSDLASILKISPLPELDARLVVWRLVTAGHVRLEFR